MKPLTAVLACGVLGIAVSTCGSGDDSAQTTVAAGGPPGCGQRCPQAAAGGGATAAERPGCGQLCQQAGPPAGTWDPGCPGNDSDRCAPCPKGGCAELLSDAAEVRDGIFTVGVACKVDRPCVGALKVYPPDSVSDPVAASDISVAPGATATVPIALTTFGGHVVGVNGDFEGVVDVFLEGSGIDQLGVRGLFAEAKVRLTGAREELLRCSGGILVSPNTNCPFAENLFRAYKPGLEVKAQDPSTGRSYQMSCYSDAASVYCTGGNDAFVTFPKGAG